MGIIEDDIERNLINKLGDLKYIFRDDIHTRKELEANFREKFEELNRVSLGDSEFKRLLDSILTSDVYAAAKHLRQINSFERDDGTPLYYTLVNIKDWCKNSFEVIHQLRMNTDASYHRYDVILLINGVPVAQIELKGLDYSPRRAMQQIIDYKNDPGNGYTNSLLCFMQLFIVSNETNTYYFANNNHRHFNFDADEQYLPVYQFANKDNGKVTQLYSFAEEFLAKCTFGQMISRYMVLVETEQKLLIMRPYQIYAVKAIVDSIQQNSGNGYIWHTTGSGKTLTSFKASTLLRDNPNIYKCLFVVDRKDLDRQTRDEFNKFQKDCVEENSNTASLVERLLSDDYDDKVIVTTIQKLGLALNGKTKKNYKADLKPLSEKRIIFIFDECHRSQFGDYHKAIKEFFPKSQLFGFTGTPIFEDNAYKTKIEGEEAKLVTTEEIFQNLLHAYTIGDAIDDRNVLKFNIDFYGMEGENIPQAGAERPKTSIIKEILAKHDKATADRKFNAIMATASIPDAIEYVKLFEAIQNDRQQADPDYKKLSIACVFSPPSFGKDNGKSGQGLLDDLPTEQEDNKIDPEQKKEALSAIINDYNKRFSTNFSLSDFDGYYKDVQLRIKNQQYPLRDLPLEKRNLPENRKIDITIVVDMLLTGFDSKYLNTLYVDKNLKHHGLIQAFSRTNRILNDSKPYGNIRDFRYQKEKVDEAIKLFSQQNIDNPQSVWQVEPAAQIVEKLRSAMDGLTEFMNSQGLDCEPSQVTNLKGDEARITFIKSFKEVQKLMTELDLYMDKTPELEAEIEQIIPQDNLRAFRAAYIETAIGLKDLSKKGEEPAEGVADVDFELVLFSSAIIDYDYIMGLIARITQEATSPKAVMTRDELIGIVKAEAKFINDREAMIAYIESLQDGVHLTEQQAMQGFAQFKAQKSHEDLAAIAARHGLTSQALAAFAKLVLDRHIFDGDKLSDLFEAQNLGWKARGDKELALMADLAPWLRQEAKGHDISGLNAYE